MDTWEKREERRIRIFVSSTFKDMQAERDELVKRIFPQLRKLCTQRGVTWGEVDLRWGVTDEQSAEGKVLPICLEEIRRCRPYFIGILGERYGWVPDEIPSELIEREPWLAQHREHSVTELEILHGVLNDPGMAGNTYFYFRDPAYLETLPPDLKREYSEEPTRDEIRMVGTEEAHLRAQKRKDKLGALKQRIRDSRLPLREDYLNPQTLGEWVLQDLTALINRYYPEDEKPGALDREAAEHESFAVSRSGVYVGRSAYFEQLDAYALGGGLPLVVLGESGSGKSALLANWALRYRNSHPDELVLMHFIGATPASSDWVAMLTRILDEMKQQFNIRDEIPDNPDALRVGFANWLNMASARGQMVLVIDALNQLEDRDGALDLVWLPTVIPENVRLVVSTLPGKPEVELKKRGWHVLQVEPLRFDERKQLIEAYLAQYSKALSSRQLDGIAAASQTSNPLYLRVLLDELRIFGVHEQLEQRIEYYLSATTPDELYEKVLDRCEKDYERGRRGLVRDAMSLIWASRRGLSEAELLEMLSSEGTRLPIATWSPLSLALEGSLLSRVGLIGFAHDYFRQAVKERYLSNEQAQEAAHVQLVEYFKDRDLDYRKLDELPWQLLQSDSWMELYDLLATPHFFEQLWLHNKVDLQTYWARIEDQTALSRIDAYRQVVDKPSGYGLHLINWLAGFFQEAGLLEEAMVMHKEHERLCRQRGIADDLAKSLGNQAVILTKWGKLKEAIELHKQEEQICRQIDDLDGLQRSLGNQGNNLYTQGELEEALLMQTEMERICRQIGDLNGLSRSMISQAAIMQSLGNLEKAMAIYKESERIGRQLGNLHGLSLSLGGQAIVLNLWGKHEQALAIFKEEERICRQLGDLDGLQRSLGNQGIIINNWGKREQAMALYKEKERICRQIKNLEGLSTSLGNQGGILRSLGKLDEAMAMHREEESLCRQMGNLDGLQVALGNQANIYLTKGNLKEAMDLYREQERICLQLGNMRSRSTSLGNQAVILARWGRQGEAMALHKEEERISRQLGYMKGLQRSLGNQANILFSQRKLDEAMKLHKEREGICRQGGDQDGLASSLSGQASILFNWGRLDQAMTLNKQAEGIYRQLGDHWGLEACLGRQAMILSRHGKLNEALALHQEQVRICRQVGIKEGLCMALVQLSAIYLKLGDKAQALRLVEEALSLAKQYGYSDLAKKIEGGLGFYK